MRQTFSHPPNNAAEEDDSRKKSADIPSPTFSFSLSGGFRGVLLDR